MGRRLLGARTYSVSRLASGSWSAGGWVDGAESTFTVRASIQPLSERERDRLPEGTRERARYYCYTHGEMQAAAVGTDASNGLRGDVITYKGRQLEVIGVEDWTDHRAPTAHRQYLLGLLGDDEVR